MASTMSLVHMLAAACSLGGTYAARHVPSAAERLRQRHQTQQQILATRPHDAVHPDAAHPRRDAVVVRPSSPSAPFSYEHQLVGFDGGGWVTGLAAHASTGILYARTDVGGAYVSKDGAKSWSWLPGTIDAPGTWGTQGIATNHSDPSGLTVIMGTGGGYPSPGAGIWRSTDGGSSWAHVAPNVSFVGNANWRHASECIVIDDARPWRVWAAAQEGLYRSMDGGVTWTAVPSFITDLGYNASAPGAGLALVSLVPFPSDPSLASHVIVGGPGFGLAISMDDGASWSLLPRTPVNWTQPYRVVRMSNGSSIIGSDVSSGASNVYLLTATNWSDVATYNVTNITPAGPKEGGANLVELMYGESTIVAAWSYPDSLYVSRDGGITWEQKQTLVTGAKPEWWTSFPDNQYVSWGRNRVVTSVLNPGTWILASGFGVVTSVDEGDNWSWSSAGIGEVCMFECASHPSVPNMTWCGAMDLTGFILNDTGVRGNGQSIFNHLTSYWDVDYGHAAAWTQGSSGEVGVAVVGNQQMYSSPGQWITWPSFDENATFVPSVNLTGLNAYIQFIDMCQSPDDPQDILMTVGWGWYGPWNRSDPSSFSGGLMRTTDGGATWHHVASQPPSGFVGNTWVQFRALVNDAGDADTRWWSLCNIGLFVSRDRGETWNETVGWPYNGGAILGSIAADATPTGGAGKMYALVLSTVGTSLVHTTNYGANWTVIGNFSCLGSIDEPNPRIAVHASGRIAIVAAAPGDVTAQVYVSLDSGATWMNVTPASLGQHIFDVDGLNFDRHDPTALYVSTSGRSVTVIRLSS